MRVIFEGVRFGIPDGYRDKKKATTVPLGVWWFPVLDENSNPGKHRPLAHFLVEIADVTVHRKELRLRSKSIRPSFVSIRSNSKFGLNQSLCILRLS